MTVEREVLIAPCGMDCAVCSRYLAQKYDVRRQGIRMAYCAGCRVRDRQCAYLKKRCSRLLNEQVEFCSDCPDFPCERLAHLDRRYRTNYRMSFIENLQTIKKRGMDAFLAEQSAKWRCSKCGGAVCCHNGICFACGIELLRQKQNLYRWEG